MAHGSVTESGNVSVRKWLWGWEERICGTMWDRSALLVFR